MMGLLPAIDPAVAHAAAATVGALLLIGAVDKLRDGTAFRAAVENYRLLPNGATGLVARTLPLLEAAAGALLLPTATRSLGAALALALLALFTGAIVVNLLRGRDRIDCGCGGTLHTPLSWGLVLRNALLMLLTLAAAAPLAARATVWLDVIAAGFATLFLLGLYHLATTMLSHHAQLIDSRNAR